jgi:glutamate racemase
LNQKSDFIGVFDSGVGGMSVLRQLVKFLPNERFLYFGDSANAPYGTKTTEEVRRLTLQNANMLLNRGVKALVVACNTATSAAINDLRQRHPDAIIVGIEPALKLAADRFPTGKIGIMATAVTLREEKLSHLQERFPDAQVTKIPAPGLVELIEKGKADSPETKALLQKILAPYVGKLDALVLGCTHYPFVKDAIAAILGDTTQLLDGGEGTARQTKRLLEQAGLLHSGLGSVTIENSLGTPELLMLSYDLLDK